MRRLNQETTHDSILCRFFVDLIFKKFVLGVLFCYCSVLGMKTVMPAKAGALTTEPHPHMAAACHGCIEHHQSRPSTEDWQEVVGRDRRGLVDFILASRSMYYFCNNNF